MKKNKISLILITVLLVTAILMLAGCNKKVEKESNELGNAEIIKNFYTAYVAGDFATALDLCAEDIEFFEDGSEIVGKEDLENYLKNGWNLEYEVNIVEIKEETDDTVKLVAENIDYFSRLKGYTLLTHEEFLLENGKIKKVFITMDEESLRNAEKTIAGRIGIQVKDIEGRLFVGDVVPDSPAAQAGIRTDEEIIAVDGVEYSAMRQKMSEAFWRVVGPVGTEVELTLIKENETEPYLVKVTRVEL